MTAYSPERLAADVSADFDLSLLAEERTPIAVGFFEPETFPDVRVNHYLIKDNDSSEFRLGEADHPAIRGLLEMTMGATVDMRIPTSNRYCFLTIDQGAVELGDSQRETGWHIDGMQGDEVPIKQPGDLQFVWSDKLPTSFAAQSFDMTGIDPSRHNVFDWVGRQVNPMNVQNGVPNAVYALTSYHVHSATLAQAAIYRRFARLSFTHLPVTSTRMTVNPEVTYNYPYHTTTGAIPAHLS
jgi:hypothetical protein